MDVSDLVDELARPEAFPEPNDSISVEETHISVVFLGTRYVYKVKKPVTYSFVNYGSLEARKQFCRREVVLNRRLAPEVYLGVVPVTRSARGFRFEGDGEPVEWAVKMRRLPESATLADRIEREEISETTVATVGRRIAAFHERAERGSKIARYGRYRIVAGTVLDNLREGRSQIGSTVERTVFERLAERTRGELIRRRPLIERRARHRVPRDTHGDLRAEHVYLFPERPRPHDVVIVDCVEFNDRLRYGDPIGDQAFLEMDLRYHGRPDLARSFTRSYLETRSDPEGRRLLPLYSSYRSAVRAKVQGLKADDGDGLSAHRARAHWLLALGLLETPGRRPALILVGGLPGTGKSTLARALGDQLDLEVVDTDRVRKERAGLPPDSDPDPETSVRLYSERARRATYRETMRRARARLLRGERVLVDASFHRADRRRPFVELGRRLAVPVVLVICETESDTVRRRLADRANDPSDADWSIYRSMREDWEPIDLPAGVPVVRIDTGAIPDAVTRRAVRALRTHELA